MKNKRRAQNTFSFLIKLGKAALWILMIAGHPALIGIALGGALNLLGLFGRVLQILILILIILLSLFALSWILYRTINRFLPWYQDQKHEPSTFQMS